MYAAAARSFYYNLVCVWYYRVVYIHRVTMYHFRKHLLTLVLWWLNGFCLLVVLWFYYLGTNKLHFLPYYPCIQGQIIYKDQHFLFIFFFAFDLATVLYSLWGLMFPIEQIIHVMLTDGLIFESISTNTNNNNTRKPIYGLLCAAVLSSLFAGLFTIGHLIDLLSIGTLLAFIVMAIAIVMLRYVVHIFLYFLLLCF